MVGKSLVFDDCATIDSWLKEWKNVARGWLRLNRMDRRQR
jgi:hypothetical protein